MGETMRAYRMTGWGAAPEVTKVPVPAPGPGEVLVRVAGCGLCRSDLTMRRMPAVAGEKLGWRVPFTLGHETAGWIAEVGPAVAGAAAGDPAVAGAAAGDRAGFGTAAGDPAGFGTAAGDPAGFGTAAGDPAGFGLAVGEPVALVSPTSCGICPLCVRGLDNACRHGLAGRGYGRDGGLADYVLVTDRRGLLPLGGLDPRHAGPLTDAGATAFHAVRRARPRILPGGTAVVFGVGGLGAFAVQFLRLLTAARVVAVDPNPDRLTYAASVGAHETVSGVDEATAGRLRALTAGLGADAVLDFVGTDESIGAGLASLRPAGAYGLIGSAGGRLAKPWFGTLPSDGEVYTFQGSSIADAQEVVALAAAGLLRNEVTEFPFTQVDEAYAKLAAGTLTGRAVVLLDER